MLHGSALFSPMDVKPLTLAYQDPMVSSRRRYWIQINYLRPTAGCTSPASSATGRRSLMKRGCGNEAAISRDLRHAAQFATDRHATEWRATAIQSCRAPASTAPAEIRGDQLGQQKRVCVLPRAGAMVTHLMWGD